MSSVTGFKAILSELKADTSRRLDQLERLFKNPSVFVSDYFYSIRNEIDLEAETLLIEEEENQIGGSSEASGELSINEVRQIAIDELKRIESDLLLSSSKDEEKERIIREYKPIWTGHSEQLDRVEFSKLTGCEELKTVRKELHSLRDAIMSDVHKLRSRLLKHNTVLFKRSNLNKLGIIVIIDGISLNEFEIKFAK